MRRSHCRAFAALLVLAGAALVALAQAPAPKGPDKKPPAKLPPGGIVALYEGLADALRQMPNAVLLSPEKFHELTDELDRLRKLAERPPPRAPSKCVIKGKVADNVATLALTFELATEQPGETVALACGQAHATAASLGGKAARISFGPRGRPAGDDGFFVEIDRPGEHTLTLDLVVAVTGKPGTQALALDLPRAAITKLELALPAGATEPRLGGKPLAETLVARKGDELRGTLGAADKLELSWRPPRSGPASPVLAADGVIQAHVTATELRTEAQLRLSVVAGAARTWRLLVPVGAKLEVAAADEGRVEGKVVTADQKHASLRTIQLKTDSSEPLTVTITATQPAPKPGAGPSAIGPFTVLGAARQSGSVTVSNGVSDWHLDFTPHGDLTRRALTADEPALVAAFRYGPGGGGGPNGRRPGLSWLDVAAESVRGHIKAKVAHALSLKPAAAGGARWHVQTTLTVTPRWGDLDRLRVTFPPGCDFHEDGSYPLPDRVRGVAPVAGSNAVELRLNRAPGEAALQPFTVKVEGIYAAAVDVRAPGKARLALPRAEGVVEQGVGVTASAPAVVELLAPDAAPGGLELVRQATHEISYQSARRGPEHLDLSWRPYRPPARVTSVVDLTLGADEAQVRQELRYQLPAGGEPARLALRVPAGVSAVKVVRGGKLLEGPAGEDQTVQLAPADARRPVVVLEYTAALPAGRGEVALIGLVAPEGIGDGELRVRVLAEPGSRPAPAGPGWAEQNIEEVPGRQRLPVLVLRAGRPDQPLRLRLGEGGPGPGVLIERALVRVEVAATGVQTYRASYRLARLAGRWLDVELPAPAPTINLQLSLGGKRLDYERLPADSPDLVGRLVRVRLSAGLVRASTTLEIAYQLSPDRMRSTALYTHLQGPRLLGEPGAAPTRWQVAVPGHWVVLTPEPGPGTPRVWGWLGWLLAPRVGLTAGDLERWLAGGGDAAVGPEAAASPALLLWRDGGSAVTLTHVPRQAWLLACSLALVLVMLMLGRLARSGTARGATAAWLLGGAVVLAVLLGVMLRPALAAQVAYACQPGAAVLLLVGLCQWLLHERYRRQLVFLPSFSKPAGGGSSLTRPEPPPAPRPYGEPSTVDVPRAVGSSVERRP